jgi:hypothetical protein
MSKFLTELDIDLKAGSDNVWILQSPLCYHTTILKTVITVPRGFETDLASVPRVPVAYMMWGGRAHREAVIHDMLYRIDSDPYVTFETANKIFLEAMKARKKPWYIRYPMYAGVCIGGFSSYHKRYMKDKL